MASDYDTVSVDRTGAVGTIRVARPEAMNALNQTVLDELAGALDTLTRETRVVVVTGEGEDAFIGGGDITEFKGSSGLWFHSEFRESMRDVETAIEDSRVPVIAAVNGVALGGGTEIALMCDLVVAAESARFGFPEITLGVIPGSGGTQRVSHLVGYLKAKELILTGKQVEGNEAADIGLVNEVVPDDDLYPRVDELAEQLAQGPAIAQWFAKKTINQTRAHLDAGLELEAALTALLFETEDKEEGLGAFIERREPTFGE